MTYQENNSSNTYVKKYSKVKITSVDSITVCITNHIIDVTVKRKWSTGGFKDTVKVDKDHYMVLSTGEIKEYNHPQNQGERMSNNRRKSMNKKFSYLRQYINMNFKGEECERHITLTYSNPTKDMSEAKKDFKKFWKRFVYRYGEMAYIAVFEPHKNGAWHIHVLVKNRSGKLFAISKKEVEETWKNGFVKITKLNHDDIGSYFCNLLGQNDTLDKRKKSSRLDYYPPHSKIYTSSKELEKPSLLSVNEEELKQIIGDRKAVYEQAYSIRLYGSDLEVTRIGHITYNDKKNPYN